MKITPQRAELIMEAVQLREFGWTQQQIADDLNVPRRTIAFWLSGCCQATSKTFGNNPTIAKIPKAMLATSITLFPCRYEQITEKEIPPESIDLVLTDPPYLVSSANISRNNQNDLRRDFGEWDKASQKDYANSVALWAKLMASQLKPGGSLYLFMAHRLLNLWSTNLEQCGLSDNGLLIWHRNNPAPQIRQTRWCPAFDMILFSQKAPPKHSAGSDKTKCTMSFLAVYVLVLKEDGATPHRSHAGYFANFFASVANKAIPSSTHSQEAAPPLLLPLNYQVAATLF